MTDPLPLPNQAAAGLGAEVLCPAPFMVMDFAPEGNVHACCVNAAYPLGNVRSQTLREIWDGDRATALRQAMTRRDFGYGCGSCRHRLELGTGEADLSYYRRNPTPKDTAWPELMAFGLHNTCNLACVMCGGNLSSRLRALEGRPRLEPAYGERFFAELAEFLPHLRRAEFRGGEPFLVREHHRVWDLMTELGVDIETQVTTNGTVWNDHVERVLDGLDMQVTFSIDGVTAATNTAIRVGTDHVVVLENLDRFADHARRRGTRLDVSFCVLRHNWFELADLIRLADELGVEGHPQLVLDRDHGLQRLPTPELREVLRELEGRTDGLGLSLEVNREAWAKMLGWLGAELRQRSEGHPLRLWEQPGEATIAHAAATRGLAASTHGCGDGQAGDAADLDDRRRALAEWSSAGAVGEMVTDADDRVVLADLVAVVPTGLGPPPDVLGGTFEEALDRLVDHLGPNLWVIDEFERDGVVDQTILLSPTAQRDKVGLTVRLSSFRSSGTDSVGGGVHTLLAADDYYWPRDAQPAGGVEVAPPRVITSAGRAGR